MNKKTKIFELGTSDVLDKATNFHGSLVSYHVYGSGSAFYLFRPGEIDRKSGKPVSAFFITEDRIDQDTASKVKPADFPIEVIGTYVTDKNTKFEGMAVEMTLHQNGCIHFDVQADTRNESGGRVDPVNFDIRSLEGKAIPELSKKKLKKSRRKKPSPGNFESMTGSLTSGESLAEINR